MESKTKKYLIAGTIGVVTVVGALAYLQYKKLMNYALKFKGIKPKSLAFNNFDFDINIDLINKSDVNFTIESQVYKVYVNDTYVTQLENLNPVVIKANTPNPMTLSVKFNPQDVLQKLGTNAITFILNAGKNVVKVDCKLRVKMWFFTVNIPYVYTSTIKDMISPANPQQ